MTRVVEQRGHSWLITAANLLAVYGPLVLTLLTFQDLVAQPVQHLLKTLPLVVAMTITPGLFDPKRTIAATIYSLGRLLLYFIPATYAIVVVMGAPFTTHIAQTVLFSTHLAFMLFFRAVDKLGLDAHKWIPLAPYVEEPETGSSTQTMDKRVGGTGLEGIVWGTLAGAYLGAVPIPLDWDRDWQKWPVTVHTGACLGLAFGGTMQLCYDIYSNNMRAKESLRNTKKQS